MRKDKYKKDGHSGKTGHAKNGKSQHDWKTEASRKFRRLEKENIEKENFDKLNSKLKEVSDIWTSPCDGKTYYENSIIHVDRVVKILFDAGKRKLEALNFLEYSFELYDFLQDHYINTYSYSSMRSYDGKDFIFTLGEKTYNQLGEIVASLIKTQWDPSTDFTNKHYSDFISICFDSIVANRDKTNKEILEILLQDYDDQENSDFR